MTTILTPRASALAEEEPALISMCSPQPPQYDPKQEMSSIIIEPIDIFSQIKRGTNNVRLLNSAVINQFTMLTYRQPLRAKDR